MYSLEFRAAAYDIAPQIDEDIRNKLLSDDTQNEITHVVKELTETHVPSWLYYYLHQVELPEAFGDELVTFVGDDTLNEVAQKYAEEENTIINLNNPASLNWMSEDPLAPSREKYQKKQKRVKVAIEDAYSEAFGSKFPHFDDDEFLDWLSDEILNHNTLLSWAVFEKKAKERGHENLTQTVANWFVKRTRMFDVYTAMATYDTLDQDEEAYYRKAAEYTERFDASNDKLVEDNDASDSEIPFYKPTLPYRDVSPDF